MSLINVLEIKCEDGRFIGSDIKLNGNPFPVISIELRGSVNGYWVCQARFFVKNPDVKIGNLKLISEDEPDKS